MTRIYLFAITLFSLTSCPIKSVGQRQETIYLNSGDSSANKYIIIYPNKIPWTGFMFLIPSFGESPENVLTQTDLPTLAAQKGILTIIPTFKTGIQSFGVDSLTQQSFKEILGNVVSRHKLIDQHFYVGGFSIGGSCAVKFAELAINENYKIKPTAVFAIDPPLDFERFYNSKKRNVRLSVSNNPNQEAVYFIDRIEKEIGGTPQTSLSKFYKISPYSFSDTTQTAIKSLIKTPIKFFTEPDINWWLTQRGNDYSNMNALDQAAMINELTRLGNNNATLVVTTNKGFRKPDNRRHPHSWSIAEPTELIKWLLEQK